MNTSFDFIVIGIGSMGASTCYYLSKRGYKVLGLEQFDITHEKGSHTGQSRIIRKAYFEHPAYVPLLGRAYENWKKLEADTGTQIYYQTGLVYYGPSYHPVIKGVKDSAALYNISIEDLTPAVSLKKFPRFKMPAGFETLFEPDAGFITPEKSIRLYTDQAIKNSALIHTNEKVLEWKKKGDAVVVTTNQNTYHCGKLIITAGAWAGKIIPDLAKNIKATKQFLAWIKPKNQDDFSLGNFPCWMIADDNKPGVYYGFPVLPLNEFGGPGGLKIAHHYPGDETDPDDVNRQPNSEDEENLLYALNKYMPGVFESFLASRICLYANTPDENFIIDKLPGYEDQVVVACGFSGHGFKFVSVVGEILADLAVEGKTKHEIDFLGLKRFAK